MIDWAGGLVWKVAVPVVSFVVAGAISWGVMTTRMDHIEQRIDRMANRIEWMYQNWGAR